MLRPCRAGGGARTRCATRAVQTTPERRPAPRGVQDEHGHADTVFGVLNRGPGAGGTPAARVQGLRDGGEVGARLMAAHDGLGADGRAAGLAGRVAECVGGLFCRECALLHDVGHPLRAQGRQGGLCGVAVYAKAVSDVSRGEGGVLVQELRDARGQLVAGDLVRWAGRPHHCLCGRGTWGCSPGRRGGASVRPRPRAPGAR